MSRGDKWFVALIAFLGVIYLVGISIVIYGVLASEGR